MNNLDRKLIDGLYKDLIKEIRRFHLSQNYHVKRTAADNARENERCINQNLIRCGQGYQIQIPNEYFTKDISMDVIYIKIIIL